MTTAAPAEKFETWAIVELMGHAHIAGKVSEETRFGTVLMRVDVPAVETNAAFTKYFGGSSIYSVSPCDEATVLRYLKSYSPKPISIYVPQPQNTAAQLPVATVDREAFFRDSAIPTHIREDDFEDDDDFGTSDDDGEYYEDDFDDDFEDDEDYDPQYDFDEDDFVIREGEEPLPGTDEDTALDILEAAYPDAESAANNIQTALGPLPSAFTPASSAAAQNEADILAKAWATITPEEFHEALDAVVEGIITPDNSEAEHPHGMMPNPTGDSAEVGENSLSLYEDAKTEENSEESAQFADDVTLPTTPIDMKNLEIVQVVRIERQSTKDSKSPSWEMSCSDGKKFWVFQHKEAERNTWVFFRDAGYENFLQSMKYGDVQRWQKHPIEVTIYKDGGFYKPSIVTTRNVLAKPDSYHDFWPQRRIDVVRKARDIKKGIVIDVESTGTGLGDVITELACENIDTGETWTTLVKPSDPNAVNIPSAASGKKPVDINGITAEMLKDAPSIKDIAEQIYFWTENQILIGHQVDFDIRLLNQSLKAAGLDEIKPKDTICTMHELMDIFVGDPFGDGRFRWQGLQDSAFFLGIMPNLAHRALADVRTTIKIIKGLATLEFSAKPDKDYFTKDLPF